MKCQVNMSHGTLRVSGPRLITQTGEFCLINIKLFAAKKLGLWNHCILIALLLIIYQLSPPRAGRAKGGLVTFISVALTDISIRELCNSQYYQLLLIIMPKLFDLLLINYHYNIFDPTVTNIVDDLEDVITKAQNNLREDLQIIWVEDFNIGTCDPKVQES